MKMKHRNSWTLALVLMTALALGSQLWADSITARIDSNQMGVGDSAQLTVTISGSQTQPTIPNVDGLDITPVGQSTQIEIINGSMTANASDTYMVTPQREGTFVIPAIHAGNATSQPITLHVGKGSAPASSPSSPRANPALPPPALNPGADDVGAQPTGTYGSLQITVPKKTVYVGELVPVEIKAIIPDGLNASVTDLPQFTSDGFTLNALSAKPEQTTQMINGRPSTVLTWHSALTAVKTGDHPISLQMPESVVVRHAMPQMNTDDDDSFDNFFRNAFASMQGVKKDVTLETTPETVTALPLPEANRPADFSGAVGQFDVESSATPVQVNVGDPITLRLKVTGTGNFDRVSPGLLSADANWKTYHVTSHFEPSDSVGYQGVKTFEQPVIPNNASVSAVPAISFSFFNPETRQYVTRTTSSIAVAVSGAPAGVAPSPAPQTTPVAATPPSPHSDLRANQMEPGSFVASLRPVYLSPWFVAGQSIPILALVAGLGFVRRRRLASNAERVRATVLQQAIRQQVAAMDDAMQKQQTDAFFIHARTALQQRYGQQWNLPPETITFVDIESRLGEESGTIRPIFEMADQASYSDLHFEEADLRDWRQVVLNELKAAEKN